MSRIHSTIFFCCLLAWGPLFVVSARAETMLQYFNTSWVEITNKMPELAEAGYTSLWLPPPTKGSGGLSVGYDLWDPFDLGSKNQRGSVRTRYGTEAELLRLVETAHRFGIRIYFDNIMNHRAFDVPGYNENTPIDTYPGLVPEDFHLRVTQDGFYRKWDNTRDWGSGWQVQNLGLADLIDIAQEPGGTNQNFGTTEGSTGPKIKFIRDLTRPEQYCYLPNGTYVGFGPTNGITTALLQANPNFYGEYVEDYIHRSGRWLMDRTKADGLRLDAVKHVRDDFFGASGAGKDESDYGYTGQVQRQFNITRGFTDTNHRNSLFDIDAGRDDAMLFGEHLGEPPGYDGYIDRGQRLVDNPLRTEFNSRLGNPSSGLGGFDQPGYGGFSPNIGVMHAQSHDNDYAARRELQHAFYFLRQGLGLLYTDGNYQAETLGESGGAFPRHANTSFLGQWNDARVPNLLYIHDQFARGYQVGRWSDADFVAWERLDKRENSFMSDSDGVTMLVMLNDNYSSGQGRSNVTSAFPAGAYLHNYSNYGGSFYKTIEQIYSSSNPVLVPAGGYFVFSWKNPDPSDLWKNHGGRPVTITQSGGETGTVTVKRKDGPNGDKAFNGNTLPEASRPVLAPDTNVTDYTYSADIPRITNGSAVRFVARADGSAENILLKLDGGVNLNAINHVGGDSRDNPPGASTDVFHGYEQPNFVNRIHPELFAAVDTGVNNTTGSSGAGSYLTTGSIVPGTGVKTIDPGNPANAANALTALFLYHNPGATVENLGPARSQWDNTSRVMWAKTNAVGAGYKMFLYYYNPTGTSDPIYPEGAGGRGAGATKAVEMNFRHNQITGDPTSENWWSTTEGTLPVDFIAGTTRYKIAIYRNGAPSWWPGNGDAVTRKQKMMTTFETMPLDLTTLTHRPHADYGETRVGLAEGMHVIRARAFLDRGGKASIYNTFTQTFYFDAERPTGEVLFPAHSDTVGGSEYGVVVRTDSSVTEVWYNIDDGDSTNDDTETKTVNGNGDGFEPFTDTNQNGIRDGAEAYQDLNENGSWNSGLAVSWVKATEVVPTTTPTNAAYTKEWRLTYRNIPPSGTASINVRLRELSSAAYKDFNLSDVNGHYTTLARTVTTAGPNIRMFVAYPTQNGETIGDDYDMKVYFTKSLADGMTEEQLIDKFTIRIGPDDSTVGTAYSRDDYDIIYHPENEFPYHELAFTLPNLYNDQPDYLHKIEVTLDRTSPAPDLTTTRTVKFFPSNIPRISINTPPELDSDGKPYEIILPAKATPAPEDRKFIIRVATASDATNVVLSVTSGPMDIVTPPVTSVEGNTKFWDFTWQNMTEGEFIFTATVNPGGSENHETRNARVIFRQFVPQNASDNDDDDDGLLDLNEASATPLPSVNSEQWTNGQVHVYHAFGRTNPISPDSDGDLLPDALEVGWRAALVIGENFTDTGYGAQNLGAGNGIFDFDDVDGDFVHDVGEASEPFTDADADNKFDFGTITTRNTDGDAFPNFIGDIDPPFYNTLDNITTVPGISSASLGGDRASKMRGSVTDPANPDSDGDGIKDGMEDKNRNGWLDGDGASLATSAAPSLGRNWPDNVRNPGETWLETSPNNADTDGDGAVDGFAEDKNGDGVIAGDTNGNRIRDGVEVWTETDPLNEDSDGDGLRDGWEIKYAFNPLDTAGEHGASGNPDGDLFTNLQEQTNGTDPRKDNALPPPPANAIVIGPRSPITFGGITHNQEFTDWLADDLVMLDQYEGDGTNNQGTDIYNNSDGFDSSRDIVAFYAHDGGAVDGNFYFRIDLHDLRAYAEDSGVNLYVAMDFGNAAVGEYALPDDVDTGTNMRWEAVVACYQSDNGAVYVDTNPASNTTAIAQNLTSFGVQRRDHLAANGFGKAFYSSTYDAVEFSISRQALIDAGWGGNPNTINYQVFSTKDGTANSPVGAGDIGGRSDIRDSMLDDVIASDYWRDQTSINGAGSVLKAWFGLAGTNDKGRAAKVVSLMQESRPLIPGNEVQALINNGAGAGLYRPLDVHQAYSTPMSLHIPATLASAIQWAKVDPAANKPWRDGPAFNTRLASMKTAGTLDLVGASFSSHILPYFPASYTQDNIALANDIFTATLGGPASSSVLYPAERVVDERTLATVQACGFTFTLADQMRHITKWFGRTSALGDDGYRLNQINGVKVLVINDQASAFRFENTDNGLGISLRTLLSRKSRSGAQDQVVILHSEWTDFLNGASAMAYDKNIAWIACHPWIKLTTPSAIAAGQVDVTRDSVGDVWPVINRGTIADLPLVAKDWVDHATQENYDNWYNGQIGLEEGLATKIFNIRSGAPMPQAFGQLGVNGISNLAWSSAGSVSGTFANLRALARGSVHSAMYLTAFHDQSNGDLSKFSTGTYINPDTSNQMLAGFAKAAQSQARWAAVYARVSTWALAASAGTYLNSSATESADVDLDGENEFMLFNDRVFAVCEAIGGRMTAAWVRDLSTGQVLQVIGNPVAYSGFDSEIEGEANVIGGLTGSYRTSGCKDWFAAGAGGTQYINGVFTAQSVANGWQLTSADGKVVKTLTLAARANSITCGYTLDPTITTLFVRHGFSPNLMDLLKRGQTGLGNVIVGAQDISLINSGPEATVRAYAKLISGVTYNAAAIDDDPVTTFDTLNMRNQAQTQQIELSGASDMSFALGFETGSTLSNDTDNDALPDAWEAANGLNNANPNGVNGATGNLDSDGMDNLFEFIVGRNPNASDTYIPAVSKVPTGAQVVFDTIPDRFYKVFYSDNLISWNTMTADITGDGSIKTIIDDGTATTPHPTARTNRFYKVEVRLINP